MAGSGTTEKVLAGVGTAAAFVALIVLFFTPPNDDGEGEEADGGGGGPGWDAETARRKRQEEAEAEEAEASAKQQKDVLQQALAAAAAKAVAEEEAAEKAKVAEDAAAADAEKAAALEEEARQAAAADKEAADRLASEEADRLAEVEEEARQAAAEAAVANAEQAVAKATTDTKQFTIDAAESLLNALTPSSTQLTARVEAARIQLDLSKLMIEAEKTGRPVATMYKAITAAREALQRQRQLPLFQELKVRLEAAEGSLQEIKDSISLAESLGSSLGHTMQGMQDMQDMQGMQSVIEAARNSITTARNRVSTDDTISNGSIDKAAADVDAAILKATTNAVTKAKDLATAATTITAAYAELSAAKALSKYVDRVDLTQDIQQLEQTLANAKQKADEAKQAINISLSHLTDLNISAVNELLIELRNPDNPNTDIVENQLRAIDSVFNQYELYDAEYTKCFKFVQARFQANRHVAAAYDKERTNLKTTFCKEMNVPCELLYTSGTYHTRLREIIAQNINNMQSCLGLMKTHTTALKEWLDGKVAADRAAAERDAAERDERAAAASAAAERAEAERAEAKRTEAERRAKAAFAKIVTDAENTISKLRKANLQMNTFVDPKSAALHVAKERGDVDEVEKILAQLRVAEAYVEYEKKYQSVVTQVEAMPRNDRYFKSEKERVILKTAFCDANGLSLCSAHVGWTKDNFVRRLLLIPGLSGGLQDLVACSSNILEHAKYMTMKHIVTTLDAKQNRV